MSTRNIKDAKDLTTGELIFFKGHAQATFMSDGRTVEEAINSVGGEENVQSDWDVTDTSSDAYIKNKPTLSTVAKTGSYDDLSNKPTIPSAVTESMVSGWGFTKNAGTITEVKMNGNSITTSGTANIPAASTSAYGVTKLSSATNSNSEELAATPKAVKAAYDLANSKGTGTVTGVKINGADKTPSNGVVDLGTVITAHQDISGKQDKLVSGTNIATINNNSILGSGNFDLATSAQLRDYQPKLVSGTSIKTINGESILGSGDIVISGGGGKEIVEITDISGIEEIMPNKIYVCTSPTYDINIWEYITTDAAVDEYIAYFKTGTGGLGGGWTSQCAFPDGTLWANGVYPETEPNTLYELSIVKTTIDGVDYFKAVLTPFKSV